jgi:selenocysteine-specific elongation factor
MIRRTLGTAGHIDHGKTTLVGALTGTDTDRLAEEKLRGISITLGYARLVVDDTHLSVVDVPGHERFVRTMIAGATGIDLALLCIACDDGVMPQTREHLAILDLLGVRHGVVALTKSDLVDPEGVELARLEAGELLAATGLRDAPIIPVSVRSGDGLAAVRDAVLRAARAATPRAAGLRARLPIDRVFSLRGIGTVVTGTLWSGTLRPGDQITILPGGARARVRSLQAHDQDISEASPGSRIAVALVGVERGDLPRGSTLVTGDPLPVSYRLDVAISPLVEIPHGALVEVLHATSAVRARIVAFDEQRLTPAGGVAQLRLEAPLSTLRGDHLIIRRLAAAETVAGARVLDPAARRHRGAPSDRAWLAVLGGGDAAMIIRAAAAEPVRLSSLVVRGILDPDEARRGGTDSGLVALDGDWVVSDDAYDRYAQRARSVLADQARRHPLAPAVPLGRVAPAVMISRLERDGVLERVAANAVATGTRAASSAAGDTADSLVAALAATPFAPPRLDELLAPFRLASGDAHALVVTLEREGRIVRLPDGLAVTRAAYDEAVAIVAAGCGESGSFTLAQLRDATGSSRRFAQALLERMDSDGVTRRVGDHRVLRRWRS